MRKEAVINVKNNDERCFEWAILSGLYPPTDKTKINPFRVSSYTKYRDTLNFDGFSFPVHLKDIPKFEKQNPQISVNVISLDHDSKGFSVDYLSPERHRPHHINLLLIQNSTTQHYVYVNNFSRLVADRTAHKGETFVCNSCLNTFSSQRVLDSHIPNCLLHEPQQVVYPDPDDCKLKFSDQHKQHPLNFYLVCDFESFLTPVDDVLGPDAKTHIVEEHQVSGFCCYRVSSLPQYQTPPFIAVPT